MMIMKKMSLTAALVFGLTFGAVAMVPSIAEVGSDVKDVATETSGIQPSPWSVNPTVAGIQPPPWGGMHFVQPMDVAGIQPPPWGGMHFVQPMDVAGIQPPPWGRIHSVSKV